jgi:4-diphosphocytidyl-2-C-methyl-D-erythritol kinase
MTTVREIAKAKINLDLRVCGRRDDGYHELDSLVVFADLGDELLFLPADGLTLSIEGPFADALADERDNLVLQAARRLAFRLGRRPDVHVRLVKRLPVAAGVGGGSADAAAALRGLLRFWGLSMTIVDLAELARGLGADVPVCLGSKPVRMTGIGERMTPFELPENLPMLLVNPGLALATPSVFKALRRLSGPRPEAVAAKDGAALLEALRASANDLELPATGLAPVVGAVLAAIAGQAGCRLARMSGSGATCFGLFDHAEDVATAQKRLQAAHPGWWIAASAGR